MNRRGFFLTPLCLLAAGAPARAAVPIDVTIVQGDRVVRIWGHSPGGLRQSIGEPEGQEGVSGPECDAGVRDGEI